MVYIDCPADYSVKNLAYGNKIVGQDAKLVDSILSEALSRQASVGLARYRKFAKLKLGGGSGREGTRQAIYYRSRSLQFPLPKQNYDMGRNISGAANTLVGRTCPAVCWMKKDSEWYSVMITLELIADQIAERYRDWFEYFFRPFGTSEGIMPSYYGVANPLSQEMFHPHRFFSARIGEVQSTYHKVAITRPSASAINPTLLANLSFLSNQDSEMVEVEEQWMDTKLKALTCYFGGLGDFLNTLPSVQQHSCDR
ncbi:hypothetical protein BU15DRAFT_68448 [Melanogaster broomeanus]|nr:hypothetical protein BU15DRAFT_68448 [Melanogaster broomeanus]